MSTVKDLKNGAIFELALDGGIGYGYVKMLFSSELGKEVDFDMFIIKIYNVFSETSMKKSFDAKLFETDDLITFPPNMYFRPVLRGKDSWKYIGQSKLTEEDYILPDYIDGHDFEATKEDVKNRIEQMGQQSLIHNFMNKRMYSSSYDDVKHLGFWSSQCSEAINRFLSIYWLKKRGIDPYKFYDGHINRKGKRSEIEYFAIGKGFYLYEEMPEEFHRLQNKTRLKALKVEEYKKKE